MNWKSVCPQALVSYNCYITVIGKFCRKSIHKCMYTKLYQRYSGSFFLEPYVPYEISVRATNRAAAGETREIVIFTREGSMFIYSIDSTSIIASCNYLHSMSLACMPTLYCMAVMQNI